MSRPPRLTLRLAPRCVDTSRPHVTGCHTSMGQSLGGWESCWVGLGSALTRLLVFTCLDGTPLDLAEMKDTVLL